MTSIDPLDARLLLALDEAPESTILSLSHTLGVARNTVHARLRRLADGGVLAPPSRRVRPEALGYRLIAFVSLEASQAEASTAQEALTALPEIVEVHSTTGDADFLVKVVARDTHDLRRITSRILAIPGIVRSSTVISLDEVIPPRMSGLLEAAATAGERSGTDA